jgi:hypothetical protein
MSLAWWAAGTVTFVSAFKPGDGAELCTRFRRRRLL